MAVTNGLLEPQPQVDVSPEGLQRTLDLARRALRTQDSAILALDGPDALVGTAHASILAASVAPAGEPVAMLVVRDVADRFWSEDDRAILEDLAASLAVEIELRREQVRQRGIFDKLPGLVFERRKIGPTEARYTFLGSSKTVLPAVRELIEGGTNGAALRFVHRDDRDAVRNAMQRSTVEESDLDLLFRVKDFDHELRWLRSQSVVRREPDGAVVWSGFCFDVTDLVSRLDAGPVDTASAGPIDAPIATMPPGAAAEAVQEETAEQNGVHILLADDLDLNRKLICDMLSLDGYTVDSVADGAAAVEAVKAKAYDLVLMDMIMPVMDGMDATRAIRALPTPTCDVPIVALTAHSLREQLDNCLHAGMNATLTKPMSFDALSSAVSTWAKSRRQAA